MHHRTLLKWHVTTKCQKSYLRGSRRLPSCGALVWRRWLDTRHRGALTTARPKLLLPHHSLSTVTVLQFPPRHHSLLLVEGPTLSPK